MRILQHPQPLLTNLNSTATHLRWSIRLPEGYTFEAMQVRGDRLWVEYSRVGYPDEVLKHHLRLDVAVREEEAACFHSREAYQEVVKFWAPLALGSQQSRSA